MREAFNDYVSNFDMNLEVIKRKYEHSLRVMDLCKKYANWLEYDEDDIELLTIIGLLHDIGRFALYANGEKVDYALYGAKILFQDGLISKFTNRIDDYELIEFVIRNHNKINFENSDNEKYVRFTKLIRDIDKLDTIYLLGYLNEFNEGLCQEEISNRVIEDIDNGRVVDKKYAINNNDRAAMKFSFVFDINNDIVLDELKRNYYYYYRIVNNNGLFNSIYNRVISYIDERMNKNVG